jgi:hypothetical protein
MTAFDRYTRYELRFVPRDRTNFRAICLIDLGATKSAIHQPLSNDAFHCFVCAHRIVNTELRGIAVPNIKLSKTVIQTTGGGSLGAPH